MGFESLSIHYKERDDLFSLSELLCARFVSFQTMSSSLSGGSSLRRPAQQEASHQEQTKKKRKLTLNTYDVT